MKLVPITDGKKIKAAFDLLSRSARRNSRRIVATLGWQGGNRTLRTYWNAELGIWAVFDLNEAKDRYWCCYGTQNPSEQKMVQIACEINPPREGFDRRSAGVFLTDESGQIYLGHSGKIGGGRKGIGKLGFLTFYRGRNLETVRWPDGKESDVIVLGSINGPRILAHIALFVKEVERFKDEVRQGVVVSHPGRTKRKLYKPEFWGPRKRYTVQGEIESRCDHGLVVDALEKVLRGKGMKCFSDQQRDLYVIWPKKHLKFLFEAKTERDTTSIYTGIGQLMLHGIRDSSPPKRILVVPGQPKKDTKSALTLLGIQVLKYEWERQTPIFPNLRGLLR